MKTKILLTKTHPFKRNPQAGFTLTEMLVVVAIIAMILGIVATNVMDKFSGAKVDTTKIQIRQLGTILDTYKLQCGFYPTTEQGLDALSKKPLSEPQCRNYDEAGYIKDGKIPKDSWDNDFQYFSDGNSYELKSLGSDRKEGGEKYAKDISSKE